jgi:hypothetical protein
MRPVNPKTQFLLRGSILLIASLTLWWFVLLDPLLLLLRWSVELTGGSGQVVGLTASGDWTFHFTAGRQVVYFDIPREDVRTFTFGLPVFWAIILAAGDLRRALRPLAIGTVFVAALETLMLLATVRLAAHDVAAGMAPGAQDAFTAWLVRVGRYLVVGVLPDAMPFLAALALHRGLRSQILPFTAPAMRKTVAATVKEGRRRRDRRAAGDTRGNGSA